MMSLLTSLFQCTFLNEVEGVINFVYENVAAASITLSSESILWLFGSNANATGEVIIKRWQPIGPQVAAAESIKTPRGKCAVITGFPGSDKTRLIVSVAIFLVATGFNIALSAKTNDATDNIADDCERQILVLPDQELRESLKPIRVYRPINDERELHHTSPSTSEESVRDPAKELEDALEAGGIEAVAETLQAQALNNLKKDSIKKAMRTPRLALFHDACNELERRLLKPRLFAVTTRS